MKHTITTLELLNIITDYSNARPEMRLGQLLVSLGVLPIDDESHVFVYNESNESVLQSIREVGRSSHSEEY